MRVGEIWKLIKPLSHPQVGKHFDIGDFGKINYLQNESVGIRNVNRDTGITMPRTSFLKFFKKQYSKEGHSE